MILPAIQTVFDRPRPRVLAVVAICLLLQACAGARDPDIPQSEISREDDLQRRYALARELEYMQRIYRVARPLLTSNAALCRKYSGDSVITQDLGMFVTNTNSLDERIVPAARDLFGMDGRLQVLFIVENSPAASAGIQRGDKLLRINGEILPSGDSAVEQYQQILMTRVISGQSTPLIVERDGSEVEIRINADQACDFPPLVEHSSEVNAYADGRYTVVTRGMMRFAGNENELSLVFAHELAHNLLGHAGVGRKKMTGIGDWLEKFGLSRSPRREEAEADYVGLYLLARAGGNYAAAPEIIRRMRAEQPESLDNALLASHPPMAERFVALHKAVDEILLKELENRELIPELD